MLTLSLAFEGLQPLGQNTEESAQETAVLGNPSDKDFVDPSVQFSLPATLQGKPQRFLCLPSLLCVKYFPLYWFFINEILCYRPYQSANETPKPTSEDADLLTLEGYRNSFELKSLPLSASEVR